MFREFRVLSEISNASQVKREHQAENLQAENRQAENRTRKEAETPKRPDQTRSRE